jgi:predicted  nucleic acid-binding Zn-ribbon protein
MTEEAGAPPATTEDPLRVLLAVQEHDLALDRLRYRRAHLTERSELAGAEKALATAGASLTDARRRAGVLRARQGEFEGSIDAANERIKAIEKKLYHGDGIAFRDQSAMADEVKSLEERRSHLEDDELEVMEELEPIEAEIADLETEHERLSVDREQLRAAVEGTEAVIDGEIAAVDTVRAHVVAALPSELAAEYERLRRKLGGVGAAQLTAGSCSGCHLALPATELDRIRHAPPGSRFHCEQCGRLLVP